MDSGREDGCGVQGFILFSFLRSSLIPFSSRYLSYVSIVSMCIIILDHRRGGEATQ